LGSHFILPKHTNLKFGGKGNGNGANYLQQLQMVFLIFCFRLEYVYLAAVATFTPIISGPGSQFLFSGRLKKVEDLQKSPCPTGSVR